MKKKITLVIICLIVLLIVYNLLAQIIKAVRSGDRLSLAADSLIRLQSQNEQLRKKLTEVTSTDYIEQQARNKLGLAKKGETVMVIPDERIKQVLGTENTSQKVKWPNWLGWWKVFFPINFKLTYQIIKNTICTRGSVTVAHQAQNGPTKE